MILLVFALGCGAAADRDAPLETYEEAERGVLFVEPDDLHDWIESGHEDEVVFVDNRNTFTYEQQHIANARLIPTDQMARSMGSLPLNKWLIMYCT
ncbi:hypothetical protein BH18GEM1_BH18GEM1_18900 [soil metagenome]